ncbi:MAG: arylesterase [Halioglobus sp.]|nr:arylesterase [Halioglobus sp.]
MTLPRSPGRLPYLLLLAVVLLSQALPVAAREHRLLVLGDSISAAYGMSLQQGWVALLAQALEANGHDAAVVNASISGDTTAGGLRRLPALLERHSPTLVIVELGGNDGLRGYPIGQFRRNLLDIVSAAQQSGAAVMLLPMEIPPNYGARYTRAFRATFGEVAQETGSVLGPFILEDIAIDPGMMQEDGIHPTAAAQSRMMEIVYPAILEQLERG